MPSIVDLITLVQRTEAGPFWLVSAFVGMATTGLLYGALRCLAQRRMLENTPTALVRSAAQGYTELRGMAELMAGEPIRAPASLRVCVWYQYTIEHLEESGHGRDRRRTWVVVERGISDNLFHLTDTSGSCAVDPDGAQVHATPRDVWSGQSARPKVFRPPARNLLSRWFESVGKSYRYTEHLIRPSDAIYVIGQFITHGGSATAPIGTDDKVTERLRAWKRDQASLLREFDANRDDQIDVQEWAAARARRTRGPGGARRQRRSATGRRHRPDSRPAPAFHHRGRQRRARAREPYPHCARPADPRHTARHRGDLGLGRAPDLSFTAVSPRAEFCIMRGMNVNPSYTLNRLPHFAGIEVSTLIVRVDAVLTQQRARITNLTAAESSDWDAIVPPMEEMADELHRLFGPLAHLHNVADTEALRTVYSECLSRVSSFGAELEQNVGLCAAYQRLRALDSFVGFDNLRRKLIDNALRDFRLGGVDLPDASKARVTTLRVELAQLAARFEENVLDATQAYQLDVFDEGRLAGLPASTLAMARERGAEQGNDAWTLTLALPCYVPAMSNLADRELRRQLYEAYTTRASECGPAGGAHDNTKLMHELLSHRQELALLLGFQTFAELSLATKMAPSADAVVAFLEELGKQARPAAQREFDELAAFAKAELGLDALEAWDVGYCAEQLRRHRYQLNQEELRPYFPLPRVRAGLFEITARLFGLRFEAVAGVETWHTDVEFHAVHDVAGEIRGYFYLDLYARAGKRSGAWMDDCLTRWQHGHDTQLPVAYLNCNFTPPQGDVPSLLTHDEVTTLFHEFGHGLHHLLTTIGRPAIAGINGVAWDAVELPSQFLENWCWEREALDLISGHVESGDPLPLLLFDRLSAARHFQAAMQMVRQVEFALFDFRLHREYSAGCDIQALLDGVRAQVAVVKPPTWNRFQHSFSHIFAGGYAAGYYSYKWAEVLSADAFERFTEEGIFNRATGLAFRDNILAQGGAEDALVLFRRFRGRDPQVAALLRQAGLIN